MFETIKNAFKIKDDRNKIFMTILFVIIFRLGCVITIPGLQSVSFTEGMSIFGLLDSITGSALSQGTLFSLGISPYINASIIVQLLTVAIPPLERMSKEGATEVTAIISTNRGSADREHPFTNSSEQRAELGLWAYTLLLCL